MSFSASDYVKQMSRIAYSHLFSKPRYFALIEMYCDESTAFGDTVFTVAGWVAHEDVWVSLSDEWEKRLAVDGLTYFHATDCAGGYNDFAHLSKDARCALDTDLVTAMTRHKLVGFAVSVSNRDFIDINENVPNARTYLNDHPYFIAAQLIIRAACDVVKEMCPETRDVAFFFEENESVSGQAKQIYDDLKRCNPDIAPYMGSLTYVEKKKRIPLQVADALAFEAAKNVQTSLKGKKDRMPIQRMLEAKILHRSDLLNRESMLAHIAKMSAQSEA